MSSPSRRQSADARETIRIRLPSEKPSVQYLGWGTLGKAFARLPSRPQPQPQTDSTIDELPLLEPEVA